MAVTRKEIMTARKGDKFQLASGGVSEVLASEDGLLYIELPARRVPLPTDENMQAYFDVKRIKYLDPDDVEAIIRPRKIERPGTILHNILENHRNALLEENRKDREARKKGKALAKAVGAEDETDPDTD